MDTFGSQTLPDSFYLPILSDSSGDVYPTNTLSHFRVLLETPLCLNDGEWLCGLAEVMWPQDGSSNSRRARAVPSVIPPLVPAGEASPTESSGDHASPSAATPAQAAGPPGEKLPEGNTVSPPPSPSPRENAPSVSSPERRVLLPEEEEEPSAPAPSLRLKRAPPVPGTRLFIYVDFIRPSLCSDFRGKCLRILAVDHKHMHISLNPVYYYPIEKKVIDGIFVEIKDKHGEYFAFKESDQAVVLVLHFKRVGALVAH